MLNVLADRHPVAVPTVDELASAPELAAILPAAVTAALLGRCRVAAAALEARLLMLAIETRPPEAKSETEKTLTIKEAAALLHKKPQYLYRGKSRFPFIRKIGARSYVCDAAGIQRWLSTRKA